MKPYQKSRLRSRGSFRLGLVVFTLAGPSGWAATQVWTAGGTGNFGDSTKYASTIAPLAGDTVTSDGAGSTINFDATNSISLAALSLNVAVTGTTTFNQTAGDLTLTTLNFGGGGGSRNPTYNLTGGALATTGFVWGNGSNARFKVSGGTMNHAGSAVTIGVAGGAHGRIEVSSGTYNHSGTGQIQLGTASNGIGSIEVSGGEFKTNSTQFRIGAQAGGTGNITLSGSGKLNANAASGTRNIYLGNNGGTGNLTMSGTSEFNAAGYVLSVGQFGNTAGNSGNVTMSGGTLNVERIALGGDNSGSSMIGIINLNGGTIATGAIRLGTSNIAAGSTANVIHANGGTVKAVTHALNSSFFQGAFVDIQSGGLTFDTNGNDVGINNVMSGSGGLTKSNTGGILTLTGVNTYSGGTTVNGGTLALGTGGGSGAIRGALTINQGAEVTLTAGNALGFTGGVKVNSIAINGGTLSAASGTGDQGWGVAYDLTGGTLQSNGGASDAAATSNLTLDSNSSVATLASATASTIAGRLVLRGDNGGNVNFTVADGAAATDLLVSAAITNKETFATAGFTKLGAGVMNLTGSSTYTGDTVVSAGTLLVNGSLGNTAVSVNATLGGSGSIGEVAGTNTVIVGANGILAPGNSPGTLTIHGNNTLDGGTYAYQYTGAAGPGGAADLVDVNGTLTLINATLTLEELGTYTMSNKFTLFAYDVISGTFNGHGDDSIFSANGGNWLINYDDDTAGVNGGTGAAFVTLTAVPEASSSFLGMLGMFFLCRRRR
ncbi:MAG: autotransporter-associated beta strand repeat-containing protein [Verrucomicrobiota bacterium]